MLLPRFCVVDLETSNGFIEAAIEHMMLSKLLIVPGVEDAVQIIGIDLCLLMLRPRGSMVLQGSHIINAAGILRSTPPLHISGVRRLKARSLV